jgi:hypothetical protein
MSNHIEVVREMLRSREKYLPESLAHAPYATDTHDELRREIAALRALLADAERYEFLRGAPFRPASQPCGYAWVGDKLTPIGRDDLDAAIDSALRDKGVGK